MEIIVKSFSSENRPYGEFLTDNLEDAIAHFKAEIHLGHDAIITANQTKKAIDKQIHISYNVCI